MLKKVFSYYIIVVIMFFSFLNGFAQTENLDQSSVVINTLDNSSAFDLQAVAALLIDGSTGNILLKKNIHEKRPIASITKIMSLLLVMEAIDSGKISFEDIVHVSEHAYSMGGSQVYLKPGEEFTVTEMLKAVAISSANDATVALAEKVAGSEEAFVNMMNDKAKELGMKNTNFLDCTGLTDEGHYSTAYDISVMARELILKHPKILEFTSTWLDTFRNGEFTLNNTNKLVRFYEGANGLKTGFTSKAGYCLTASAKRNNLLLISVVLGEPDLNSRYTESRKLLDYGFANFETVDLNKKGEEVKTIAVKKGLKTEIKAIYESDVKFLLKKGDKDKIQRIINVEDAITAPVKTGQKIGEVIFKVNENEIGKANLVSDRDIQKASFTRLFFRMIFEWFGIGRNQ